MSHIRLKRDTIEGVSQCLLAHAHTEQERSLAAALQSLISSIPLEVSVQERKEFLLLRGKDILILGWGGQLRADYRREIAEAVGWVDESDCLSYFLKSTELGGDLIFVRGDCLLLPKWTHDLFRERVGEGRPLPAVLWACSSIFPFPQGLVEVPLPRDAIWLYQQALRSNTAFHMLIANSPDGIVEKIRRGGVAGDGVLQQQWLANPFTCLARVFQRPELLVDLLVFAAREDLASRRFDGTVCEGSVVLRLSGSELAVSENLFYLFPMLYQSDWNGMPLGSRSGERAYYEASGFRCINDSQGNSHFIWPKQLQSMLLPSLTHVRLDRIS